MPFIDAGTLLPALLDDSRSVLGAALVSFELLAEGQGSEVFWGALYPLRQGVALLTAAQTVTPSCAPLLGR